MSPNQFVDSGDLSEKQTSTIVKITTFYFSQPLEMHEVIAEFMIFANHWVAKKINEAHPTNALLRRHPPPSHERYIKPIQPRYLFRYVHMQ